MQSCFKRKRHQIVVVFSISCALSISRKINISFCRVNILISDENHSFSFTCYMICIEFSQLSKYNSKVPTLSHTESEKPNQAFKLIDSPTTDFALWFALRKTKPAVVGSNFVPSNACVVST